MGFNLVFKGLNNYVVEGLLQTRTKTLPYVFMISIFFKPEFCLQCMCVILQILG